MTISNSILVIFPYRYQGTWVFDDERVGLVQEPFIEGMPEMIDIFVQDIPNAAQGFKLLFSATPERVIKPNWYGLAPNMGEIGIVGKSII